MMEQQLSTTESDAAGSRRSWLTIMRRGIAIAALGLVAALALVLVPGGAGPSETLAVADLSGADRVVDSANGPAVTLANDHADADRYVSADPFASLRNSDGGLANASLGFGRLTGDNNDPNPRLLVCQPILIIMSITAPIIATGYEVCTMTWPHTNNVGSMTFVRQIIWQQ